MPMQKLASILERYEYQLRAVSGSLQEIQERLDGARIVWQMQLDSLRNRIIRINLVISLCSFSLMVATVPATWLGMNVVNGWEEQLGMFSTIILGSLAAASTTFVAGSCWFMFWPNRQVKVCQRSNYCVLSSRCERVAHRTRRGNCKCCKTCSCTTWTTWMRFWWRSRIGTGRSSGQTLRALCGEHRPPASCALFCACTDV